MADVYPERIKTMIRLLFILPAAWALSVHAGSISTLPSENRLEFPMNSPVVIGEGWDVRTQQGTKTVCLDFVASPGSYVDVPNATLSRSSDKQSTFASLTYGTAGDLSLPLGKGSISQNFSIEQEKSSDSILVIIDALAYAAPTVVAPPTDDVKQVRLTKKAIDALNIGIDSFVKLCGDSFVASIEYGSRIIGRYEVRNATRQERMKYDDSVKFSSLAIGEGATGGIAGKLAIDLKTSSTEGRVNFRLF